MLRRLNAFGRVRTLFPMRKMKNVRVIFVVDKIGVTLKSRQRAGVRPCDHKVQYKQWIVGGLFRTVYGNYACVHHCIEQRSVDTSNKNGCGRAQDMVLDSLSH